MHWADVVARKLKEAGGPHRIATGITPSGHIHVGNMREILTGDLVHRAAGDMGVDSTLYYLADDFDPLRRVNPFLPGEFSDHIGKPLSRIPSPDGGDGSYAGYFLEPFLESLRELGVHPEVILSSESYRNGNYADPIRILLDNRDRVREILKNISGRELPADWFPYNALCPSCGRIDSAKATEWDPPFVHFRCSCGYEGKADTRTDEGKLPWRLDWPARWYWLGVTCEPFGKDHAASGGSYDTSSVIIREILNREPPIPVVYEWIQLKGKGAMSSSKGVVITGVDMLKMTPPEVLRFLIARNQPNRHIDMDPGLGILNLVDEFDRYEKNYFEGGKEDPDDRKRTYMLSMIDGSADIKEFGEMINVPYRHLVTLTQLVPDMEHLVEKVKRIEGIRELNEPSLRRLKQRKACVDFWLERFAPEGVKFTLYDDPPAGEVKGLSDRERTALSAMKEDFGSIDWNPDSIHNTIYEGSRSRNIDPRTTFRAFYRILLGRDRGPRLGFFLSTIDRGEVLRKLEIATKGR